jgi:hypothetical protein
VRLADMAVGPAPPRSTQLLSIGPPVTHPTQDRLVALGLIGMAKALDEQRGQRNVDNWHDVIPTRRSPTPSLTASSAPPTASPQEGRACATRLRRVGRKAGQAWQT